MMTGQLPVRFRPMVGALALCLAACGGAAMALDLADCERTTHVSHGGEADHSDFGAARVGWANWWSQEGVFIDLIVADCQSGRFLKTRSAEERIGDRAPFDRTEQAVGIIARQMGASASLFSFDRLAHALKGTGRDIQIASLATESCACAVLYPEHRGDRLPFEASQ